MDCGPACLLMVAKYYGRSFPLEFLREKCYITRGGVSMLGICEAAESIGFRTEGVKITWKQLCKSVLLPCIIHWNQHHFVVVYNIKMKRNGKYVVYVADPSIGLIEYELTVFLKYWQQSSTQNQDFGLALLLGPTPHFFENENKLNKGLKFTHLLKYLSPYKRYYIQLFLGLLTGSIISLGFPFLTQSMVDIGIGNRDVSFIVIILLAQLMLTFGKVANDLIRNWLILHISTRLSITLISDFLSKLMKLPIAFFDAKKIGDILQRIGDYKRIQIFLTNSLISILLAVITFVVYSGVMASYSWIILSIFIFGSILYACWVILFMKRRRKLDYLRFHEESSNQNSLVQLITGMQDIKLNNCERQKRWSWERIQTRLYKISVKGLALNQTQEVGGMFLDQAKNIIVTFMAAKGVVDGHLTLGMMMAMQYIIGQLNAPLSQFIGFIQTSQDAKMSMERLNEIYNKEDEEPGEKMKINKITLNSDLNFTQVVFQYEGPNSEKVLDGINLNIPAKKITAIVGASGSGKTTLIKLILGFYSPVSGRLTLGENVLENYSISSWRHHCGVVTQEGYIFSDTILNNITISDASPDMDRYRQAIQTANIEEFINSLPLRHDTKIGVDGHGLSTGQKQRMLIARAVYKNAEYILFDEATNSLDANNEKVIMENLNLFFHGKTVIIVAHRLSTVKNADKIVVLDKGKIVEEGTHKELIKNKNYYFNLIKDQLELGN